jgi:hypothetical protein
LDALWVSDARAGKVFSIDLDGKVSIVADVASRPSGLGFLPEGELLVASITQRKILNVSSNKPVVHADMSDIVAGLLRHLSSRQKCASIHASRRLDILNVLAQGVCVIAEPVRSLDSVVHMPLPAVVGSRHPGIGHWLSLAREHGSMR